MSKKLFVILILASIVLASVGSTSAQQISQYKILEFAEPFAREGETMTCNGCYYYQDQPYWIVTFTADNNIVGEIVIDANIGDVIKDENTVRKIIYASCVVNSIDSTVTAEEISNAAILRNSAAVSKDYSDAYREIAKDPHAEKKIREYAGNAAASNQLIANDYSACASLLDEIIDLENQFIGTGLNVEKTELYLSKDDQFAREYEKLDKHNNKVKGDIIVLYEALIDNTNDPTERRKLEYEKQYILDDLTTQHQTISSHLSSWESYKSDIEDLCEWEIEEMKDRFEVAETSGFGAIFAIAGLLMAMYRSRR